jgi:hypothetical protein
MQISFMLRGLRPALQLQDGLAPAAAANAKPAKPAPAETGAKAGAEARRLRSDARILLRLPPGDETLAWHEAESLLDCGHKA